MDEEQERQRRRDEFTKALGRQMRYVRCCRLGMSLGDLERQSQGRWKGVTVGSYERGDRQVRVEDLAGLAGFYGVPVRDLLPAQAA